VSNLQSPFFRKVCGPWSCDSVVLDEGREDGSIHGPRNPNLLLHLMSVICLEVEGAVSAKSVGSLRVPNGFCVPVVGRDAENLRMRREDPEFTRAHLMYPQGLYMNSMRVHVTLSMRTAP
jgi:hypothetical protein